jgi:hypothetical protein
MPSSTPPKMQPALVKAMVNELMIKIYGGCFRFPAAGESSDRSTAELRRSLFPARPAVQPRFAACRLTPNLQVLTIHCKCPNDSQPSPPHPA